MIRVVSRLNTFMCSTSTPFSGTSYQYQHQLIITRSRAQIDDDVYYGPPHVIWDLILILTTASGLGEHSLRVSYFCLDFREQPGGMASNGISHPTRPSRLRRRFKFFDDGT